MSFIQTTSPEASDGAVADMYARQQAAWGFVPNYAKVFCHRPEVLARWGRLLAEMRRPMEARRFELVTFAAAHALRHSACALVHGQALRPLVGDAVLLALAAHGDAEGLPEAERAMVRFARQVALDASAIEARDVQALRAAGCSDAEVFDIAAVAAGRAFFTKLLDALGVLADAPLLGMEAALREALAVGRPIDTRPVERLPAQPLPVDGTHA